MNSPKLVPMHSRSAINAAGRILKNSPPDSPEYRAAIKTVNEWRVCHAYPINTFQSTLRQKTRQYDNPIVAQRLKRLPTIIDKLSRHPEMELGRMHDIGGVRAVVNTIDEVRELQAQYQDKSRFTHELVRPYDYIHSPKNDGYRGVHLVYRYRNTLARNEVAKHYNGLLVELQLRTKLQHTWSTAVETMGTFRGEAFKSNQGNEEWLRFFAATSAAFAHVEETELVPGFEHLDARQTIKLVAELESKLNVIDSIRGFSIAANHITQSGSGSFYHLVVLNMSTKMVQISSYPKDSLERASKDYALAEKRASEGEDIEPVLVSAGSLQHLKQAYPNFFLDVREFITSIRTLFNELKKDDAEV